MVNDVQMEFVMSERTLHRIHFRFRPTRHFQISNSKIQNYLDLIVKMFYGWGGVLMVYHTVVHTLNTSLLRDFSPDTFDNVKVEC